MKPFETLVVLRQPADAVWSTMRDRLPELAATIDEIESVTVLERTELTPGRTRVVNEWRARRQVPEVLRDALQSSELGWTDRNVWDDASHVCAWEIEPFVLAGDVRCEGTTTFEPAMGGRGCRVRFKGVFDLAAGALDRLAGPLQRPAGSLVDTVVTTVVPQSTRKLLEAAARLAAEDPPR